MPKQRKKRENGSSVSVSSLPGLLLLAFWTGCPYTLLQYLQIVIQYERLPNVRQYVSQISYRYANRLTYVEFYDGFFSLLSVSILSHLFYIIKNRHRPGAKLISIGIVGPTWHLSDVQSGASFPQYVQYRRYSRVFQNTTCLSSQQSEFSSSSKTQLSQRSKDQ